MLFQKVLKIVDFGQRTEIGSLIDIYRKKLMETQYFLNIDVIYLHSDKNRIAIQLHVESIERWNQFKLYHFKKVNNWFRFNLLENGYVQVIQPEKRIT